jgi:(p)ppGpp synthase/HD superfamily hydrolase
MMVQSDEQREAEIERRAQERVAAAIHGMPDLVGIAVERAMDRATEKNAEAMERVLRSLVADKDLMGVIANAFQTHYLRTWREWLGTKIWNFLLYGILGATLAWLSVQQLFGKGKP